MLALKFPVGNCIECFHFSVCKYAEKWKDVKQDENNNCGIYQNLSTFDIINSFTLASRNKELEKENKLLLKLVNTNVVMSGGRGHAMVKLVTEKIRHEAIKEFAERLCEGRVSNDPVVIAVKVELKEMTEGRNERIRRNKTGI